MSKIESPQLPFDPSPEQPGVSPAEPEAHAPEVYEDAAVTEMPESSRRVLDELRKRNEDKNKDPKNDINAHPTLEI